MPAKVIAPFNVVRCDSSISYFRCSISKHSTERFSNFLTKPIGRKRFFDEMDSRIEDAPVDDDFFRVANRHISPILLNDSIDGRESKAGPMAHFFCRKKGFENIFERVAVHARSVVRHFPCHQWFRVVVHENRFNAQPTAGGHCVPGVHCEIEKNLLQLRGIGSHKGGF